MTIYEQGAEALRRGLMSEGDDWEDQGIARAVAAAVWDAIYACQECNGTSRPEHDFIGNDNCGRCDAKPHTRSGCNPCSAEHVVLTNPHNQEQRWCRPDMAEWRCFKGVVTAKQHDRCASAGPVGHARWAETGYPGRWVPIPYEPPTETVDGYEGNET